MRWLEDCWVYGSCLLPMNKEIDCYLLCTNDNIYLQTNRYKVQREYSQVNMHEVMAFFLPEYHVNKEESEEDIIQNPLLPPLPTSKIGD